MAWELKSDRPIYLQLVEQLELDIVSGRYQPGDKFPSVRELAAEASVNPNTMQKALAELEDNGLLYTQRTSGRFVTEDTQKIFQSKSKLAFKQVSEFLKSMQRLGLTRQDVITMISESSKEENQ